MYNKICEEDSVHSTPIAAKFERKNKYCKYIRINYNKVLKSMVIFEIQLENE